MFEWLKKFCEIRIKSASCTPINPIAPTTQEDPRFHESIKRTRAAFKQQEVEMGMRALKPHDASCKDILNCKKRICFKPEPDKIVNIEAASDQEVARRKKTEFRNKAILKRMSKTRVRKS